MVEDPMLWGLKLGDWATWVGAAGSILAAFGAVVAAVVALRIANEQAAREEARYARRAETHAAYIFNEIVLVYRYLDGLHALAAALSTSKIGSTYKIARDMTENAAEWSKLIDRIPLDSISELPEVCAPSAAGAISSARMLVLEATTLLNKFTGVQEDIDRINRIGGAMVRRCTEIRTNLQPYLNYARETFGGEME